MWDMHHLPPDGTGRGDPQTDRELAARRFLVLVFLSLAHTLTEQGQEMCAHSIFCKSTFFKFFKSGSYEMVNECRIENCLGLCNYQVNWAEKKKELYFWILDTVIGTLKTNINNHGRQ